MELGAGCGLVSAVLGRLGAVVTTTDLEENLPLLRENLAANALGAESAPCVRPLRWGRAAAQALRDEELQGRVNFVVASDVMYIADAVPDLVATLRALCDEQTAASCRRKKRSWRRRRPPLVWRSWLTMSCTRRSSVWTSQCCASGFIDGCVDEAAEEIIPPTQICLQLVRNVDFDGAAEACAAVAFVHDRERAPNRPPAHIKLRYVRQLTALVLRHLETHRAADRQAAVVQQVEAV